MLIALKWLMILSGLIMLLLGVITFWLPIPIGLPLVVLGLFLLIRHSLTARRILGRLMRRYPRLRKLLAKRKALVRKRSVAGDRRVAQAAEETE